jgi:hypothetical protein
MQLLDLTSFYLIFTDTHTHKICLVGVTLIYGVALFLQGGRLAPCLPRGIISLEMPRSKGEARRYVECIELRSLAAAARMQIRLDFGFIVLYTLSIFFVFEALARPFLHGQLLTPARWLDTKYVAAVLLGAGVFDAMENVAILRMLSGKVNGRWPLTARVCAGLKFALLGLASIAVLIAGVAYFRRAKQICQCSRGALSL